MSVQPAGPSDYQTNIENSINAMEYMKNELMAQAQQKLEQDAAILETLPAQTAYTFSLAVLGQATQYLGLKDVGQPSEALNSQDSTLNMCTYIQSLWNDLSSIGESYESPTTTMQNEGTNLYESLEDLSGLCADSLNPSSQYYGWMNPQTATTMQNCCDQMISMITVNSTSGSDIAYTIGGWYNYYDENPSGSSYSAEINSCTNDMNTMINTMNQTSSVTTGLMKTGVSELQQYFGAIESSGQSQQQELNYFIQNEIPS